MDSHTALKLAYLEHVPGEMSASDRLRLAKRIFQGNNHRADTFLLSDQDINFLKIFEVLDLSDRERDIMFITTYYHTCYSDYNITVKVTKDGLPQVAVDRLLKMYETLERYGIVSMLFADGIVVEYEEFKTIILK